MKDIRADLRERLDEIEGEKNECLSRISELEEAEKLVTALLDQEEERWEKVQQPPLFTLTNKIQDGMGAVSSSHLSNLILEFLQTGPHTKEQVYERVHERKYPFGNKSAKRAVHFALVGLERAGRVLKLPDGRFAIKMAA